MKRSDAIHVAPKVVETYCNQPGSFPADDINPIFKDKAWCLQFTKAVLSQHFMGFSMFPYANRNNMMEMRAYMNGKQSVSRYYPRVFGKKVSDDENRLQERLGMYRANWKIQPIIPPAVDYIKSVFDEQDFNVQAKSLNPLVNDMKEQKEFQMLAQGMIPDDIHAGMASMGLQIPPETIVSSAEEMNMFKDIGGLKPAEEVVAQMLISHIFANTDWKFIHNLVVEDILCFNKGLLKDSMEPYSGKVVAEYVDPMNFIGLIDNQSTSSDFCYAGQIKLMSIKEIRSRLKASGEWSENIERQVIAPCCSMYNDFFNNRFLYGSSAAEYNQYYSAYTYDAFHVPVIDLEYKTIDTEYRQYRVNQKGEKKYLRSEWGKTGENIVVNSKEYFYRSLMVLGTELMIEWGKCGDQQRDGLTKVRSSYHMITSPNPSIVERAIPIADDVAFDYIKYQHDAAVAFPNMVAVSKGAIEGNRHNGNNITEGESLDMMTSSGKIVYNDIQIVGNSITNNAIPVKNIPGGMGVVLDEYVTKYNLSLAQMRQILNIQQTEALPRVAVEVARLAESQTNRAISEVISMMKQLKEKFAAGAYKRLKLAVYYNEEVYNGYYPLVGRTGMDVVKLTAKLSSEDMGFTFVARPTTIEAQADLERLTRLAEPSASGLPPIEPSTYYAVRECILSGNIEIARAYMIAAESKRNRLAQAIADRNQQLQAQIAERAKLMEAEAAKALIWEKAKADNWLAQQEFLREMGNPLSSPQNIPTGQTQIAA